MVDIVYDDDSISVYYAENGNSPKQGGLVLISFSDLVYKPTPGRFSADVVAEKLGLNAIGIVAKAPNWYPEDSMMRALPFMQDLLSYYDDRVVYGGSMGGYAALKFSSALRATHVLAMCPQATINPAVCGDVDNRFQKYWSVNSGGDAVSVDDLSGLLYVFYDPWHRIDAWHAEKIIGLNEVQSHAIPVPFSGHHTTTVLAGARRLKELLDGALAVRPDRIRRAAGRMRRGHDLRARIVLEAASVRHLALCRRVYKNLSVRRETLNFPERFWTWAEAFTPLRFN